MTARRPWWVMSENAIDRGVLSLGAWSAGAPLTNLQDPRPKRYARTIDLNPSSMQFLLTLGQSATCKGALIAATNFNQASQYKVTAFTSAALSSIAFTTDWVTVGAARRFDLNWGDPDYWTGRTAPVDPDRKGLDIPVVFGQDVTSKFWKYEFKSPGNPDGHGRIGRVFMGRVLQTTSNFAPSSSFGPSTLTRMKEAADGTPYGKRRPSKPAFTASLPHLTTDEMLGDWDRLLEVAGIDQQVAVFLDPDAPTAKGKQAFLARISELPSWTYQNVGDGQHPTSLALTGY